MTERSATVVRETSETDIEVTLVVDGSGEATVETGVGFFDHMLESFAKHGLFDLSVACDGDLHIDDHHTVEDVAIALGTAFDEALGDRRGIVRFADRRVPLDEAVAGCVVDVSGRPLVRFDGAFSQARVGEFTSHMGEHFARSLATNAGLTLHVTVEGENAHHELEALFKCLARTLDDATRVDERRADDTPSTKGAL
ncbi:imidazoleglycerol-phosphate dehydratase HisB [Halomarina ordinaria]|uniref:Imidazoleglycerol-phosphate dehydratase n=1 Tax=Halomarina ordinaria TaxID=3033939 RepID=A0ABD5UAE5_9EURY|nr:imidazoleglycerol-phosphate dehydratase HisB [Halomarina sp. PSRA2]